MIKDIKVFMPSSFFKKLYPDKISARIFLLVTLLSCFSIIIFAVLIDKEGRNLLNQEKSQKLYAISQMLDLLLDDAYHKIDTNLSHQQQIEQINQYLSPKIEPLLANMPKIAAGYYHKQLDAIVVYAPKSAYGNNVGKPIAASHKGREVMNSGHSMVDIGKQVRGNIMNAMIPIVRDNQILGYIWANETIDDIEKQTFVFDKNVIIISILCMLSCILIAWILSQKLNSDIDVIKHGLHALPFDLTLHLPAIRGELNEIVTGINNLAETLSKTKTINELILENSLDGVITIDINGAITMLNPAAEKMTGYQLKQVLGKPYSTLLDDKEFKSPLLDTLYNGIDHNSVEVDFPVSGQVIKISSSTSHLKDHQGNIIGALVIFKDITEQKEIEKLIQQTERLVSLGELMAGVAHEIRNPLAAIRGFVQYLQNNISNSEKSEYITIILNEVDSINHVIQQLLDFAAPSKNFYSSININHLIEEVLILINTSHRSNNIDIELSLDHQLSTLYLDKELIKQALLNLIINAIQAIPAQGIIQISTKLSSNQKYQLICIKDNGEGIPEALFNKIFNPFFTTKLSGTGLGLPIVQKIIASHKGKITIKNNVNSTGVTVEIALPIN
ncbi:MULTISPECIES: two-component system sensor histidine kinase AtoS [unclassified Gilliamella]|uniref:two-component system sensor histidine kinase AtoS n=1 Tax=unclassified Gilliamella TaxID=2685620 RepID=UPI0022698D70|nr:MULTISPECIES: two-component system sensor histidine kinase AtoS [unclassified Gilliamella]MCX8712265.1 two-component system sensor histidine kinase AtoS [Gilliamella sp. B3468]